MNCRRTARYAALACAVAAIAVFAAVLKLGPANPVRVVDDLGETAAAGIAALACGTRAFVSRDRARLKWALLAGALASWSAGQALWSYYELAAGRETPFPSLADLGFLLFPTLAIPGVLVEHMAAVWGRRRVRVLMDGVMVATSLLLVSWATVLGTVYHAGAQSRVATAVSLAYPCTDVLLLTTIVLLVGRSALRAGHVLMCSGIALMALADSAFTYLTATGRYETGSLTDVAWVAAFLALGLAALQPAAEVAVPYNRRVVEGFVGLALPYGIVLGGCAAELTAIVEGTANVFTFALFGTVVCAAVARQLLTLLDNRELTADVMRQSAELEHLAFHDPLTGLANRALFMDRVNHALELRLRDRRPVSLVFVDLDDFKSVNDIHGHDVGDRLLIAVAERLSGALRSGSTLARLGGDEFAVLLEDGTDSDLVGRRLLQALSEPIHIDDRVLVARASVGGAALFAGEDGVDVAELIKRADVAMYSAKRTGKGRFVGYSQPEHGRDRAEYRMQQALLADILGNRVQVAYQPIMRLSDGELFAHEALARWTFLGRRVPPLEFLRLLTDCAALGQLDLNVLRLALGDTNPHQGVRVSTNTSLTRLADATVFDELAAVVSEAPLPPEMVIVEISEKDDIDLPTSVKITERLRALGMRIAVDDFGVGFSNLDRLLALQPDIVKIDRSFIAPLNNPAASKATIRSMISLCHELGAEVIGEGVETESQRRLLADLGCDAVQGFLCGRPALAAVTAPAEIAQQAS